MRRRRERRREVAQEGVSSYGVEGVSFCEVGVSSREMECDGRGIPEQRKRRSRRK